MRTGFKGQWKPVPDYHPYTATGDFNGDGATDFAAVLIDNSKRAQRFALIVFNGPLGSGDAVPAFFAAGLDLPGQGLFFGSPRPKPYRLVLGHFESDNSVVLVPHQHTYILSYK